MCNYLEKEVKITILEEDANLEEVVTLKEDVIIIEDLILEKRCSFQRVWSFFKKYRCYYLTVKRPTTWNYMVTVTVWNVFIHVE